MQSGLINKVAVTSANVTDAKGLKHVCPDSGAVYADKGYCTRPAQDAAAKRGVHLAAIMMNHMLAKNHDKDRWLSHLRMPYECVFSKRNQRMRCRQESICCIYVCHQFQPQAYFSTQSTWPRFYLRGRCVQNQLKSDQSG
jgi:IS5 family transposase